MLSGESSASLEIAVISSDTEAVFVPILIKKKKKKRNKLVNHSGKRDGCGGGGWKEGEGKESGGKARAMEVSKGTKK